MRSLAWSPKVHGALEYLPDLFDEDKQLKSAFTKKINLQIKMFLGEKQLKISRKEEAQRKNALPYSLYFLKNEKTGTFHYFISPRKKTHSLGKGGEGYAVPLYELIQENDAYTLLSNAHPALILKTFDKKLALTYMGSNEDHASKFKSRELEKRADPKVNLLCYEVEEEFTAALWTLKSPTLFSPGKNYPSMDCVLHLPQPYFPGENGISFCNFYEGLLDNPEAYFAHFIQGVKFSISASAKLKKIHDEGFLYCDLKLENMILGPNESLKFIDTNKSRKISEPKKYEGYTAHYAPKEFLDNKLWTIEGETYALGVCIFALLGGQDLFKKLKSSPECTQQELRSLNKSPLRKAHHERSSRIDENFLCNLKLDEDLKERIRTLMENLLSDQPQLRKKLESVILELDLILSFIEVPSPGRTPSPYGH